RHLSQTDQQLEELLGCLCPRPCQVHLLHPRRIIGYVIKANDAMLERATIAKNTAAGNVTLTVIKGREKTLGKKHRLTLTSMANLVFTFKS
ncbi:hypothetical protein DM02DRAFT_282071, partial [Periconia macrospinosa]